MRNSWGGRGTRKYGNTKVKYDGLVFDSEVERDRYLILNDRLRAGEIVDLVVKPAYILEVNGVRIFERPFHPDFRYRLPRCPRQDCCLAWPASTVHCPDCCTVEDVKGYLHPGDAATRLFKVCCNLMKAIYGIDVKIVQSILAQRRQEKRKQKQKGDRALIRQLTKSGRLHGM